MGVPVPSSKYQWHDWWAWYPVEVEDEISRDLIFFETIERRWVAGHVLSRSRGHWEYRFKD